jgi:hypothetical protein
LRRIPLKGEEKIMRPIDHQSALPSPKKIRSPPMRPSHPKLLALAAVLAAAMSAAATAQAGGLLGSAATQLIGGNCGSTSQAFAQFGDSRSYYLTADGGFEGGGAGWTLAGGAKVVPGNESYYLRSAGDRSSLLIPNGGTATSPALCFGALYPGIRMMVAGSGTLHVQVVAHGLLGSLSILDGGTFAVNGGWAPSPLLSTLLSQIDTPVGTKSIQIVLSATGSVSVDDIYIDPFCSR